MHIAFDAKRLFHNFTGLGNYSRTLVANLKHYYPSTRITLFTPSGEMTPRTEPFFDRELYDLFEGSGAAWRTWSVYKDINDVAPDIYHGLSHQIPFSSDKINAKTLVTIHDVMHRIRPRDFGRIDRMIYERKCKYACANADRILAISECTKNDIIRYYRTPEEKIEVIYQSCDPLFNAPVEDSDIDEAYRLFGLPEQYFLYVGSVTPRKNLLLIIEAMAKMPKKHRIPLVVVGSGRKYMGKVVKAVEKKKLTDLVEFIGDAPQNLFPAIYRSARALIFPSHYEGFGLPILEALSVGIPVIASNTSSMPEIGGKEAIYFDPSSTEELIRAMRDVTDNVYMSESEQQRRKELVKRFGPELTTDQLMSAYRGLKESGSDSED